MLSGENSILNQAGRARDITGEKQIEEKVYIAVNGAIANGLGTLNYDNLNSELAKQFKTYEIDPKADAESWTVTVTENGIEKSYTIKSTGEVQVAAESDIKIELSIAGEKVTTPPNPDSEVFEHTEGTIDTGYVIRDKDNGNEFVWVPVDKNQKITLKVDSKEDITEIKLYDPVGAEISIGTVSGKTYNNTNLAPTFNGEYKAVVKTASAEESKKLVVRSLYAKDRFNDYWYTEEYATLKGYDSLLAMVQDWGYDNVDELIADDNEWYGGYTETEDYANSVNTYGGFYIGRYEAGLTAKRTTGNASTTVADLITASGLPLSQKEKDSYTYITESQAKGLADKMYEGKSHLLTGAAWDRTLDWLINTNNKTLGQITGDSKSWGNYYDSKVVASNGTTVLKTSGTNTLLKTGETTYTSANNIFDLAGNVWEWTSEKIPNSGGPCVARGGGCNCDGGVIPARGSSSVSESTYDGGSRFPCCTFLVALNPDGDKLEQA